MLRDLLAVPPQETLEARPLAFLLRLGQSETLHLIHHAQANYRAVVGVLQARNELHRTFQDKLEPAEIERAKLDAPEVESETGFQDELERIAGRRITVSLKGLTDALYAQTKEALEANRKASELAAKRFTELYPRAARFGVEDLPPQPDTETSRGTP